MSGLPLTTPINHGGSVILDVDVRIPRPKELHLRPASDPAARVHNLAAIIGLPKEAAALMTAADRAAVVAELNILCGQVRHAAAAIIAA